MPREKKRAKKAASKVPFAWRIRPYEKMNGDGSQGPVLGLNLYCAIIDDAGFVSKDRPVSKDLPVKTKNAMLLIAEVSCSPREVRKILEAEAERLLDNISRFKTPSRPWLIKNLNAFCNEHHNAGFQRKRTIEQVAARVMRRRSHAYWTKYSLEVKAAQ